jgi:GNAT superfamily N-acetyltransferase
MSLGNPERAIGGLAVRPPAGIDLRPLGPGDLREAVAMARQLHGATGLREVEALRPRFASLLGSPDVVPFAAVEADRPVGLAILHFRRRLNLATFEGWLSELYVRADARGRGIGRALLDASIAEWRLRGSPRLQAKVGAGTPGAGAFLAAAGLEPWMIDFRMRPVQTVAEVDQAAPRTVRIRHVVESDAATVTELISAFGPARTPAAERMDAVLRTFALYAADVAAGRRYATMAELNGEAVGVCTLEWQRPFWTDELHAWLPDLIVAERQRGQGIGRALLADAIVRARQEGVAQLSLESGPNRAAAHALYRSAGFEETGRTYLLRSQEER